jgi:hypothetical protein
MTPRLALRGQRRRRTSPCRHTSILPRVLTALWIRALRNIWQRWALEMVLKRHYGHGQWENAKLGQLVFLASKQYDFITKNSLNPLVKQANHILHNYGQIERLSEQEDRTILFFLETVKYLIQRAPVP